jgi:hypothetical protein
MTTTTAYLDLGLLLAHANLKVKFGATNTCLSLSEDPEYLQFLITPAASPTLRNLLRNFENDELLLVALSTLLNISGHRKISAALLQLGGAARTVTSLNSRQRHVPMHCSFLANLSRESAGIEKCLEIPNFFRGVFLKFCADCEEQTDALGLVVINCSTAAEVREALITKEHGRYLLLEVLLRLLSVRRRRLTALRILRNVAIDIQAHQALVDVRLAAKMGSFLYPQIPGRREEDAASETKENCVGLALDVETRAASVEILFSLTRTKEGRIGLREQKVYEYLRLWEMEEDVDEVKEKIYTVVNVVVVSEEEIEKGELDSFEQLNAAQNTRPSTPEVETPVE